MRFAAIAVVCLGVIAPCSVEGQALSPKDTAADRRNARAPGVRTYRDGDAWVDVTREATQDTQLDRVVCRRDGRTFHAAVGANAIVRLPPGAEAAQLFRRYGLTAVSSISPRLGIYAVRGQPGEDGIDVAARLAGAGDIASAVPDLYLAHKPAAIHVPPNDPHYSAQWYLDRLQIEHAWRHTTGDRKVSIVVIDGGCDMQHPDLARVFVGGRDLVDSDDDPRPAPNAKGNAHGTACSGIIAAAGDNGVGIAGVCPECTLHCVRLYGQDKDELVSISSDITAFDYAFEVDAAVVSNSWGYSDATPVSEPLAFAIRNLIDKGRGERGALVVFAAGNENREIGDDELVAVDGVLNVGAINNFDEAAPFSNHGASLDLTAPNATFTTDISGPDGDDPGDYTDLFGGTSSACPVVAGVAALVVSANPELTARETADLLVKTSRAAPYAVNDENGHDPIYGYGIVDPVAAVRTALGLGPGDDAGDSSAQRDAAAVHDGSSGMHLQDAGKSRRTAPRDAGSGCSFRTPQSARANSIFGVLIAIAALARRFRRRSR